MANLNCIKGTKAPVNVSVNNLHANKNLSDSTIDLSCVFYIGGKRNSQESGATVTIQKSAMTKVDDNTYLCSVDTAGMAVGNMMCECTITDTEDANFKWILNTTTNVRVDESK